MTSIAEKSRTAATGADGALVERQVRLGRGAAVLAVAGVGAAIAAAAALWSAQGAEVFLAQAFAALAACF